MRITASDLLELGIADEVIPEPLGGAHNDPAAMSATLKTHLIKHLEALNAIAVTERLHQRYAKFRALGRFDEPKIAA